LVGNAGNSFLTDIFQARDQKPFGHCRPMAETLVQQQIFSL
jgi:hypothetical protein